MAEQKTKRVTLHLPVATVKSIEKLAARDSQDVSKVIRKAIDTHLNIQANRDDIDFISGIIRQEVKVEIRKQADRICSMSYKVGVITAANYFLSVRILADFLAPSLQDDFKDIEQRARKQGMAYMNMKVSDAVEFLLDDAAVGEAVSKLKNEYFEE